MNTESLIVVVPFTILGIVILSAMLTMLSQVWRSKTIVRTPAQVHLLRPEPPPTPGLARPTWDLVVDDMRARDATGAAKYGVRHQHDNGRDHLIDAYQEALDLCCYLRAEIEARKNRS